MPSDKELTQIYALLFHLIASVSVMTLLTQVKKLLVYSEILSVCLEAHM